MINPLHYSTTLRALHRYTEAYNQSHTPKLKASMIHTAQELLKIYGLCLLKESRLSPITPETLKPLRTNNVQMAKRTQNSTRTIQRHIVRLQEAGIITKKVFHGSRASYELYFNPEVLLISYSKPVDIRKKQKKEAIQSIFQESDNQPFKKQPATKCPRTEGGNKRYITNNIVMDVDKCHIGDILKSSGIESGNEKKRSSAGQNALKKRGNSPSGNTSRGNTGKKSAEKNIEGAGRKVQKGRASQKKPLAQGPETARRTSLDFYVKMLWNLVLKVLYKDVFLTQRQHHIGKKLLYRWFEPVETEKHAALYKHYLQRIELVRRYLEKDPENRFVQLPNRYFNPKNPNGFAGTKAWLKAHNIRKRKTRAKLITYAQIKRYRQNQNKNVKYQKPTLELYLECEKRVEQLQNPQLLIQFHEAVAHPHQYSS